MVIHLATAVLVLLVVCGSAGGTLYLVKEWRAWWLRRAEEKARVWLVQQRRLVEKAQPEVSVKLEVQNVASPVLARLIRTLEQNVGIEGGINDPR